MSEIERLREALELCIGRLKALHEPIHDDVIDYARAALSAPPLAERGEWKPIESAVKSMTPIWAVLREDLVEFTGREDLAAWAGVQVPLRHPGLADDGFDIGWSVAAMVGCGGFPDNWIAGWQPLPAPPSSSNPRDKEGQ